MSNYWENIAGRPTTIATTKPELPIYYEGDPRLTDEDKAGFAKPVAPTINWKENIYKSKINLVQYGKLLSYAAIFMGVPLTPEQSFALLLVLETLFTGAVWVLRTFFNK